MTYLRSSLHLSGAVLAAAVASAPASHAASAAPTAPEHSLDVAPDAPELERTPALSARLRSGPHAYFRFINCRFASLVCARFADVRLPDVTLHGDAHLEQYAVTDLGHGLTDFDDSSAGPATLDIVRFAASLRIAARERGWEREADGLWRRFWSGYRLALLEPVTEAAEPKLVRRLRAGFDTDRLALLAHAEAFIESLPEQRPMLEESTRDETIAVLARNSGVPISFFRVKKAGALNLGIGSADAEKYLFRVEGPTAANDDDVLLEFKQVRDLSTLSCVRPEPGPTRILVGQSHIAYRPFLYTGTVHVGGLSYWVHSWPLNYSELRIGELRSPEELGEVAFDSGVQLGRGHPKRWSPGEAAAARLKLARGLPAERLRLAGAELAAQTIDAWERFCAATKR